MWKDSGHAQSRDEKGREKVGRKDEKATHDGGKEQRKEYMQRKRRHADEKSPEM